MASTAELTYLQQEQLVREVTGRLQDVDIEERSSLADILGRFRQRPDITLNVAQQVDQVIKTLLTTPKSGQPKTLGPWDVPPSETMLALLDRFGNRGSKPPIISIPAAHLNLSKMADSIKEWYTAQGLEVQELRESSRMLIQCRSHAWQRRVGAGMAISVILWMDGDDLLVQIGSTKWIDKVDRKAAAAGAGIAAVLLSPLLIVPAASIAVGASRQNKLSAKTVEYIKSVIPDYLEETQAHSKDGSEMPRQLEQ
jgi:hypothetical protein